MKRINKVLLSVGILLLPILSYASGVISITQIELDKQLKEGNILSDGFTTIGECSQTKDKYNMEFTSYKRSDCFLNDGNYKYFICQLNKACNVSTYSDNTNELNTNTATSVPNKDKLDIFLNKIKDMQKEFSDKNKYKDLLVKLESQLKVLGDKYKTDETIGKMVGYLGVGIQDIKSKLVTSSNVDDFFCELLGNCDKTTNTNNNTSTNPNINTNTNVNTNTNTNTNTNVNTNTNINTNTTTPTPDKQECVGTPPPTGAGVIVRGYSNITAGPEGNTWSYGNGGRCSWTCGAGYAVNGSKTSCVAKQAGEGLTVNVYDYDSKQPISGVSIDIKYSLGMSVGSLGTYQTNGAGTTNELFLISPLGQTGKIIQVTKSGYNIISADGCKARITSGYSFCDGVNLDSSVVNIYIKQNNVSSGNYSLSVGNSLPASSNSACISVKDVYFAVNGVNRSNPPKGCARLSTQLDSCINPNSFRDFTASEWQGDSQIVTVLPAKFPVGTYEVFLSYGDKIVKAGSASLYNCAGY
ncbi:hypothetical protein H3C61_04715 [Candidatus Gracilibacteria bacterium]|nr:hypothetical protein [Candidatus Gracilibacteria bacterium]